MRNVLFSILAICSAYCGHFADDQFMSRTWALSSASLHLKAKNNFKCRVLLTLWLATVTTRSLSLGISSAQLVHRLVFAHVTYQFDEKVEDFAVIRQLQLQHSNRRGSWTPATGSSSSAAGRELRTLYIERILYRKKKELKRRKLIGTKFCIL